MTPWKGVVVYLGGCFSEGLKDADFAHVDKAGTLHVWRGDDVVKDYFAGDWEDYRIEGGES